MFGIRRIAVGRGPSPRPRRVAIRLAILAWWWVSTAQGAEVADAWQQLYAGNYTGCVALAQQAIQQERYQEDWHLIRAEALMTLGRYAEARTAATNALEKHPSSLRLRLLARDVFLGNGETATAVEMLRSIDELFRTRPWSYRDPTSRVALGRAALLFGADPKLILEQLFDKAKEADPELRDAHLASGQLALEKHDFALAAKAFQAALKQFPRDADFHYGLARAYASSERARMMESIEAALTHNPNHVPSLLLLVDHQIDAEEYAAAEKLLARVRAVNPWHPEAWACLAVVAHLQNDPATEHAARETALRHWKTNPRVDHWIGLKLSQKYRFAEGAVHQRQALQFDRNYLPAQAQLAQDLLRLGEESEGWKWAEAVHQRDGYDVAAYNLITLRETLDRFQTVSNSDFIVRLHPHEAALYGQRALALLDRAKSQLCAKYGLTLEHPTIVEIFPSPKDFGVRTFGMPDNPGFLGVCFGRVITANSPASQGGHPANWEAVLWHEFCHVVTLQLTRNKMPRWLSEGISVYEEQQADRTWGQALSPRYREMILGDDLTPVANLSAAFLSPRSEAHLQFAYYQSALVVEYLVSRFGLERLKAMLRDLGQGEEINATIAKHTAPMATIEKDFATFARQRAEALAPGLDWEKPPLAELLKSQNPALDAWAAAHPTNYWALLQRAQASIDEKQWRNAKAPLTRLLELYPHHTGPESAYRLLALVHRSLQETNLERQVLTRFAALSADATETYLRLMELDAAVHDWPAVARNAQRYLAVNPLVAPPHRYLARAGEALGESPLAITAYRALLQLDPPNPVDIHFRLARLLHAVGDPAAKRHVLEALEEAPRFREAHRLLRHIETESLKPRSPPSDDSET